MKTKRILSVLLAAVMLLGILTTGMTASASLPYTDVNEDSWSWEGIKYVTENGLMNGTGGTSFSPTVSLTRSMVVTVLYRMEGSPRVRFKELFLDVEDRKFYSEAVVWAKENGIVTGTGMDEWGEEYFSPDREITRQELATMFIRFAEYKNVKTETTATLDKFTDNASVADWASDAMKWATDVELIKGTGNGDTLSPTGKATREQFAAIMHRYATAEFDYNLVYEQPRAISKYTEQPYPLVDDADLYVAVDGNDKNSGTKEKPLATFEGAKAKVRELKKTAKDEIVVAFMAGEYGSLDNVTFTAEDGGSEAVPIKYCKYGDGEVIFCNGIYIEESKFTVVEGEEAEMFKPKVRPYVYKADLSGEIDKFDSYDSFLFSEQGLATEAREPNGNYYTNMTTTVNDHESIKLLIALPGLVESYKSLDGMKINGFLRTGWTHDSFLVKSYDPETDIVTFDFENSKGDYLLRYPLDQYPLMFEGRTDDLVYFSNLPEFVDANGEYCFVNETSTLYVYRAKGDYWINEGTEFVTIEKEAEYISFVGFDFNTTTGSGIVVNADHFTFDLGKIYNVGGKAAIDCPDTVKYLTVKNSEFFNCVEYCVSINTDEANGGWENIPDQVLNKIPGHNVIENNYFHDFTLPTCFTGAVGICGDVGTVVAHNYFKDGAREAVGYSKSIGLRIEYNVFDTLTTNTEDCGALSTGMSIEYTDNIIRNNIFMNIRVYAIYLDANTSYQEVYGNIFYNSGFGVVQNGGHDNIIDGNVFLHGNYAIGPASLTRMSGNAAFGSMIDEEMSNAVGENNVMYSLDENPLFVNPSIGDYRIREGVDFYDIPYEKIGRY